MANMSVEGYSSGVWSQGVNPTAMEPLKAKVTKRTVRVLLLVRPDLWVCAQAVAASPS